MNLHLRAAIATSALLMASSAFAADFVYEIEPNNTPAEATEVRGATIIIGALQGNDQDGYKWVISDVDATKRWTLELAGIPGRLTVVDVLKVEYAENGIEVSGAEKLFTIGSRDGTRPGLAENLLFEPGEYILGVAHSGDSGTYRPPMESISFGEEGANNEVDDADLPGGYRLYIREGAHFAVWPNPVENDSKEKAQQVSPGAAFAAFAVSENSWFRIPVNESQSASYWDFAGQVPVGRSGTAFLRDAQGEQLALAQFDPFGKFAIRDLGLGPGDYYLEYQQSAGDAIRFFGSTPIGQVAEGREAEPNGNWNQANRIIADAVEGRLAAPGDTDYFRLAFDETHSGMVTGVELVAAAEQRVDLCLLDGKGQRVQCRNGIGTLELPDLVLPQGEWGLSVHGSADTEYTLTRIIQGEIEPGLEAEPNDTVGYASSVPAKNRITGRLSGTDTDFFRIIVTDEARFWRFQAVGEGVKTLRFYDGSGIQNQQVTAAPGQQIVRMENVLLLPGQHYISVYGQNGGEYTLLALPRPRPDPNAEREPNDDVSQAQGLDIGLTRTGQLLEGDRDSYRFHLANWDHIRLTVTPPPDGSYQVNTYWDTVSYRRSARAVVGEPIIMEGLFQPGDFRVELLPKESSEAEYSIRLERLPRFSCPADCEPNDNPAFANPLPYDGRVEGQVGEWGDWDWYEMPVFDQETPVRIKPEQRPLVSVLQDMHSSNLVTWDQAQMAYTGTIPAGQTSFLMVRPSGPPNYRLEVSFDDGALSTTTTAALPVTMRLDLEADTVSGYRAYGQRVEGSVALSNTGTQPLELNLQSATSDRRWLVRQEVSNVTIAPGESSSV
ncbi:hypothetical protein, partial [Marinobacter sediminum]|uniref:hypothetical protein n=1 Tax=Marinobacter sediminum TaxID=256323 RepID=UPI003564B3E4